MADSVTWRAQGLALARVRSARGLSISEVARRSAISVGHLSRLESGERQPSERVVNQIAVALGIPVHELQHALGVASSQAMAVAADTACAFAFTPEALPGTRQLLRRVHVGAVAEQWRRQSVRAQGGEVRVPVDPAGALRAMGYRLSPSRPGLAVHFAGSNRLEVGCPDEPVRQRFLLAHAAGHIALEGPVSCDLASFSDGELDASAFAAHLLMPRAELRRIVLSLGSAWNLWSGEGAGMLAELAERFAVPLWMAVRRAAEEGFLAELAEVGER